MPVFPLLSRGRLALALALATLTAPPTARAAVTFDDGLVHDFFGVDLVGNNFVRDSIGGDPTTLNMLGGSELGAETAIEDASRLNVFSGATLARVRIFDAASIKVFGGAINSGLDLENTSDGTISAGDLDVIGREAFRLFGAATLRVTGGTFDTTATIVAVTNGNSALRIEGGDFGEGDVRAEDDSAIDVFGGAIASVVSLNQAVITLYGDDFVASVGGSPVLTGFGEIPGNFNGTITGTLADGTALNADGFNGVVGSRIVLAPGAVGAPLLPAPGLALLALGLAAAAALRTRR